jgi:SAM-dependent methyltransferase
VCHDYFQSQGYADISFTGLDVINVAPDLSNHGMRWRFIQHDVRKVPMPLDDNEFDMVMLKDVSLTFHQGGQSQRLLDECVRILRPGGFLEVWETDHILRRLLPHPPSSTAAAGKDSDSVAASGAFLMGPATPFAKAQNRYIQNYNAWIHEALDRRKLPSAPCAVLANMLLQESEILYDFGYRRIAIPLAENRWENDSTDAEELIDGEDAPELAANSRKAVKGDQAALRSSCLLTVVQMIEAFEPLLREVSGKTEDEWQRWWAGMMSSLLEQNGASTGECLEAGAWWSRKV